MPDHAEQNSPRPGFLRRYVFSLDHKVIGLQYYFLALASVLIAVGLSLLMRLEVAWPGKQFGFLKLIFPNAAASGTISPELYLSMVTMHGTLMVFFVLTVAPQSAFGNYFLPVQIGARDMAFPRLNMLSFWTTLLGLLVLLSAFFAETGVIGPISGWTAYAPLSSVGESAGPGQGLAIELWIVSIALFCL
ncbi:MAG: cbb3-type cytochrome c oxidase subunit I, partial [Blastocatellia bacterium]